MSHRKIIQYFCAFMLLIVLTISCTGCVFTEKLTIVTNVLKNIKRELTKPDPFNQAVDDFFAALDAGDKEAIKEMFAPSVQNEDTDLEKQIEYLIEKYPGPTEYCGRDGADHESHSSRKGKRTSSGWSPFPVISNGEYYWCTFEITYQNDTDKDQAGITQVCFFSFNDYCDIRYDEDKKYPSENGLIVCLDYPLDCEVRSVGGEPYKYTSGKGVLDEAEIKEFLVSATEEYEQSWWYFEEKYGEPNASLYDYYHIYELPSEDGQPRYMIVSGEHDITSVSIFDDIEFLYNLWSDDDK